MKKESTTQKTASSEKPSPYELSRLTIMAGEWLDNALATHCEFKKMPATKLNRGECEAKIDEAMEIAWAVWKKSCKAIRIRDSADAQLKEMLAGIFRMPPDEWEERIRDYDGDKNEVRYALHKWRISKRELLDKLYDKNFKRGNAEKLLMTLPKWGFDHNRLNKTDGTHAPVETVARTVKQLEGKEVNGWLARLMWDLRQKQKAFSASRTALRRWEKGR